MTDVVTDRVSDAWTQGAWDDGWQATGDGSFDLGEVAEAVLLRLGRPDGVPTRAWTPALQVLGPERSRAALAASDASLIAVGLLDEASRPTGALAPLAALVAETRVALSLETSLGPPDGVDAPTRAVFLVGDDRVLLLVHLPGVAAYRASLLAPDVAVAALSLGLDPFGLASRWLRGGTPRHVPAEEAAGVAPGQARRSTVRMVRAARAGVPGGDGVPSAADSEAVISVVGQRGVGVDAGVLALGAKPDGGLQVQAVGQHGLVDLAVALLGLRPVAEVAA